MTQTQFTTAQDARDYVLSQFPIMATMMLGCVQPDRPNFYEGDNPIYVYTGERTEPKVEFIITPYETENEGNPVFGIRLDIPSIESAIDYIVNIDEHHLMQESTVCITYHAESIGKVARTDQQEGQRRMMKFAFIESYVQSFMQGLIDKCRGWSPYADAIEYMQAMQSDNPPPTAPKKWLP